jgi:mRNA interferase RelE/StbE
VAYEVRFASGADRELRKLDFQDQRRITRAAESLASNPRPPGVKKLAGPGDHWRIRVGDYRIIYEIRDAILLVLIIRVGHRGDVYR